MVLKILFVPVSSPKGIGEYMRSMCLAEEIKQRHPDADIRFILNEQTEYHKTCPFPVKLTPRSPTLHTKLVNQYISEFNPQLVLFDASGRVGQLRHCKKLGIKTIFICPRGKKLSKGLALRRLQYTDRIWLVQPQFALQKLSIWAKFKLNILNREPPLAVGPIFAKPDKQLAAQLHKKYQVTSNKYIVVSSGSGGHYVNNRLVTDIFADAAINIAKQCDLKVIVVYGLNASAEHRNDPAIIEIPHLDPTEFNSLLQQAHAALLAGGSSLLQSLTYHLKVVAAPITEEQQGRVSLCASLNLLAQSDMDASSMAEKMLTIIAQDHNFSSQHVENGLNKAIDDLDALIQAQ
ncbi:hypothetical protein [Agarilytica rhodophyticola]|uniref:hypothetical protein n=1 Tax=Agarilytica rhodophyticola TaxID=1737490 RepID=UPI000CD952A4|nr:hypothetical protein [Agarilytica rhodophyticola]